MQYSLAKFTIELLAAGAAAGAEVDVTCATGTLTEGADVNEADGIPTACVPNPAPVYAGTRFSVQLEGAADDNVAGTDRLAAFLRANLGQPATLKLTPLNVADGLPTVSYPISACYWPSITYAADASSAVSAGPMPLTGPPTYTDAVVALAADDVAA